MASRFSHIEDHPPVLASSPWWPYPLVVHTTQDTGHSAKVSMSLIILENTMSTFRMTIGQLNTTASTALQATGAIVQSIGNTAELLNGSINHHLAKQVERQKHDLFKYKEVLETETLVELYQLRESVAALPDTDLVAQIREELKNI